MNIIAEIMSTLRAPQIQGLAEAQLHKILCEASYQDRRRAKKVGLKAYNQKLLLTIRTLAGEAVLRKVEEALGEPLRESPIRDRLHGALERYANR